MQQLKLDLYALCVDYIEAKIQGSQQTIDIAQQAANQETKSSMGDKHETGRAMMQLEIEKLSFQLAEWLKMQRELSQINPSKSCENAQNGTLVICENANYFIAIAAGKLKYQDQVFLGISLASPIGKLLFGKKAGEAIVFNERKIIIQSVH